MGRAAPAAVNGHRPKGGRAEAIISSMTREERRNPDVLKASRKKRIAAGSGTRVEDVNRLLKMHRQMADVMKAMGQGKRGGLGAALGNMLGIGGGGLPQPTPEQIEALQKQMGGQLPPFPGGPGGAPGGSLPPLPPGLGGGKGPALPGLGGPKIPGLPGLGLPFGDKKK